MKFAKKVKELKSKEENKGKLVNENKFIQKKQKSTYYTFIY